MIRVLLVDDEREFLELMLKRLRIRGFAAAGAASGQEALTALRKEAFDVVVLDLKMPGMDGIETLKEIKKLAASPEVILLTGHGSLKTGVDAMSHGAFDYMLKPFALEELLEKVNRADERKRLNPSH